MLDLNFHPFPILTTQRLVLRRFNIDDTDDFFELRSDAEVMKYIARPLAKTHNDAAKLINVMDEALAGNNGITWCISLKTDLKFIGSIGFWRIEKENYRAEIGYLLSPAFQGQGIMQEAFESVIAYGFKQMQLHSIAAKVIAGNYKSIKFLEKNNFIREGHFKEDVFFNDTFSDTFVYTLLTKG